MRIIGQSYEILSGSDFDEAMRHIELCGRVAYKSEDKITEDSSIRFAKMINDKGHGAVLEHSMMTVRFVTDRGVSHELVRHRMASFTQESTRYCNYGKDKFGNQLTFICPVWMDASLYEHEWNYDNKPSPLDDAEVYWMNSMLESERTYLAMLEKGWTPQQARSVLPNSLKTEIIITANYREWLHIFELRAVSKAAHPQMRDLMIPLYELCRRLCPMIFDIGDVE